MCVLGHVYCRFQNGFENGKWCDNLQWATGMLSVMIRLTPQTMICSYVMVRFICFGASICYGDTPFVNTLCYLSFCTTILKRLVMCTVYFVCIALAMHAKLVLAIY